MCTVGEAGCENKLFGDRDSWFKHELTHHRTRYDCALCTHGPLAPKDLQAHIQKTHGSFSGPQLQMLQEWSLETLHTFNAQDCPFCDDWADVLCSKSDPRGKGSGSDHSRADTLVSSRQFKRHVANHQEQFAIIALPQAIEKEDSEADEAAMSHAAQTPSEKFAAAGLKQAASGFPTSRSTEPIGAASTTIAGTQPPVIQGHKTSFGKTVVRIWTCVSNRRYS